MPRRKKCRWINAELPLTKSGEIELMADELEAIRLTDVEQLSQTEAAQIMGISQPTLHRVLKEGRKKMGVAVLENRDVKVAGGEHTMRRFKCFDCDYEWSETYGSGKPACPSCESSNSARLDRKDQEGRGKHRGKRAGARRRRGNG